MARPFPTLVIKMIADGVDQGDPWLTPDRRRLRQIEPDTIYELTIKHNDQRAPALVLASVEVDGSEVLTKPQWIEPQATLSIGHFVAGEVSDDHLFVDRSQDESLKHAPGMIAALWGVQAGEHTIRDVERVYYASPDQYTRLIHPEVEKARPNWEVDMRGLLEEILG